MSKSRSNLRRSMRIARKTSVRNQLAYFARTASHNAKRSSIALDIPFEIIKDGNIYRFKNGEMVKLDTFQKIKADKVGLSKGSKICLK